MRPYLLTFLLNTLALLLLTSASAQATTRPTIVASMHPHYDLIRQIVGDEAEVVRLLPIGASPHTFDPTPRDVARISEADLVVFNGGIDEWLHNLVAASGTDAPLLELLEVLEFEPIIGDNHAHEADHEEANHDEHDHGQEGRAAEHTEGPVEGEHPEGDHAGDEHAGDDYAAGDEEVHHDEVHAEDDHHDQAADDHADEGNNAHEQDEHNAEHDINHAEGEHENDHEADAEGEHDHRGENPHVWLDPVLMAQAVPLLVAAISEIDPDSAAVYEANGGALVADLEALHAELAETLEPVRGAAFVPFHDAWPYFTERYGLDQVVVIEPSPGREPSPSYLAEALALIESSGAQAIFNELQLPARPAEVLAEQAGVALYTLDPEGGGTSDDESYQEFMRENAQTIVQALSQP